MRNITVKVSDGAYRDPRVWAAPRNNSVSAIMQCLLQTPPNLRVARAFSQARHLLESTHSACFNTSVSEKSKSLHAFFALSNCAAKNNQLFIKCLPRKTA